MFIRRWACSFGWMLVLLLLAGCQGTSSTSGSIPETGEDDQPLIRVTDQSFATSVVVDTVVVFEPVWLVIRAERSGQPAEIIGYTLLVQGEHQAVEVEIDPVAATERLFATLYTDAGEPGEFEIGDPDAPVEWDGQIVTETFTLLMDLTALAEEVLPVEVEVAMSGDRFDPARLVIRAGATVHWVNRDDEPHTVTAEDFSFRSETLNLDDEYEFTFTRPGRYPYYCEYKGGPGARGMAGVIVVLE